MGISIRSAQFQDMIQQGVLTRIFYTPLIPRLLWRAEAGTPIRWPSHMGESQIFTGKGLPRTNAEALAPGQDPGLISNQKEQWEATIYKYPKVGAKDVDMSTSAVSSVDLLFDEIENLGINAGTTMDKLARNPLFNAALSGWTVADGAGVAITALRVKRMNGFTRARNPFLPAGSNVKYDFVSAANPLRANLNGTAVTIIGFTPDIPGDEIGPGTLTLQAAATWADRDFLRAEDASWIHRVGVAGQTGKIDLVQPANTPTAADVRSVRNHFKSINMPGYPGGYYHAHIDPDVMGQLFADPEFQRMSQSAAVVGSGYLFEKMVLNVAYGCIFLENTETPYPTTVNDANAAQEINQGTFSLSDPFGGEVWTTGAVGGFGVKHTLFTAPGGLNEYTMPEEEFLTDAGITGFEGTFNVEPNGVKINTNGITLIVRAPLNRHMDEVSVAWKWVGGFVHRTDGVSKGQGRYKRSIVMQSGGNII